MPWTNDQMYAMVNKPEPEEIARYDLINKPDPDELKHYGVLGMKWGVRRYQNKDGSYTEAGKRRAKKEHDKAYAKVMKNPENIDRYYDKLSDDEIKNVKRKYADIMEVKDRRAKIDKTKREAYATELKIKESERKMGILGTAAFAAASIGTIATFLNSKSGLATRNFVKRNAAMLMNRANPNFSGKAFVNYLFGKKRRPYEVERTYWRLA